MVNLLQTRVGETLLKASKLDEAAAWIESITPSIKRDIINEYIQKDQLTRQGVDEDGTILGYYKPLTELLSQGRKKAGTPYNLNDTGAFYRSMFVTALNDGLLIDGDTNKMEGEKWWIDNNLEADKILGLTDENLQKLITQIQVNYLKYVSKILGIN
jgi:hypothetical protein